MQSTVCRTIAPLYDCLPYVSEVLYGTPLSFEQLGIFQILIGSSIGKSPMARRNQQKKIILRSVYSGPCLYCLVCRIDQDITQRDTYEYKMTMVKTVLTKRLDFEILHEVYLHVLI